MTHSDDEDLTREPEMVQAYRDTWELGLHSYLTYMRDRLLLARDLLRHDGSVFVQISDENLHHVRELMDEVFGAREFCRVDYRSKKTAALERTTWQSVNDYLLWYAKDRERVKVTSALFAAGVGGSRRRVRYIMLEWPIGNERTTTRTG